MLGLQEFLVPGNVDRAPALSVYLAENSPQSPQPGTAPDPRTASCLSHASSGAGRAARAGRAPRPAARPPASPTIPALGAVSPSERLRRVGWAPVALRARTNALGRFSRLRPASVVSRPQRPAAFRKGPYFMYL